MDDTDAPEEPDRAATARRIRRFDEVVRDRTATTRSRLPFGVARLAPDMPRVHGMNEVDVTRPVAVAELLPAVERVVGGAGLAVRRVRTSVAEVAWTLAPALHDRGWSAARHVVLCHDRSTPPTVSPLGFAQVDIETWAPHARRFVADEPWGRDAAVQDDMAARDRRLVERIDTTFVLGADGAAGCHVYRHGQVAQVEEVHVLAEARGQGLGTGLMAAALAACGDAQVVFLVADADDWPVGWYRRLGFTPVSSAWVWTLR